MFQLLTLIFMLSVGWLFMSMNHPLAMGLILLIQTTIIAIYTGLISLNFWFSYILFLVFLGGMLVLFIYVASLASNELFSISSKLMLMFSFMTTTIFIITLMFDPFTWVTHSLNLAHFNLNAEMSHLSSLLIKMYDSFPSLITIILITYLFLTLLVIVNITDINKGPLRPLSN